MMKRNIKMIGFDLDGTLTDTLESLVYATNQTLENLGLNPITVEQCRMFVGNGVRKLVMAALEASGDGELTYMEEAMKLYLKIFSDNSLYHVKPYEGILELLKNLRERGIRLAVHSNKPHEQAVDVVRNIFGDGIFDIVQGQEEGLARKPDPAGVVRIAGQMGVDIKDCIYIGDSEVDIQTGANAGIPAVGAAWGFRGRTLLSQAGAKIIIDRPEELLHYV